MDYYDVFIKKREISRDINFFYNQIKGLISNNIFPKYLRDSRKKIHKIYTVDNFLSTFNNTKLQFINDKIEIEFFVNDLVHKLHLIECDLEKSKVKYYPEFKDYKIDNIKIKININLQSLEHKNKIIYDNNQYYTDIRKKISEINKKFIDEITQKENSKYLFIYKKLFLLKPSSYEFWNNFLKFIIDITDPKFEDNLHKLDKIVKGIKTDKITLIYNIIHDMNFYIKYSHYRQIKTNKFITKLFKELLDEEEIIYLTRSLAMCFNHEINNLNEIRDFLENLIIHINGVYHQREMIIDSYVIKIFQRKL